MKLQGSAAFVSAMLLCGGVSAATPYDYYAQGKFDAAVAAGRALNTAEGFTTAARAELARAAMSDKPCLSCIQQAQADARAAIARDPAYPEAHVYLSGALGYEGRIIGKVEAELRGYPATARRELDAAIAADPDNAKAYAARGGWNIEIVHGGGAMLARMMFGARLDDGLADFRKAFTLAPDDPAIRYQYALTLSGFDPQAYRGEIDDALAKAQALKARTAYETFVQDRARQLQAALRDGDPASIAALVRKFQGYP
jgi:hypothetical protein